MNQLPQRAFSGYTVYTAYGICTYKEKGENKRQKIALLRVY